MQHYARHDPDEREPLDSSPASYDPYNSPRPVPPAHGYSQPEPSYYDNQGHFHPAGHPDSAFRADDDDDDYSRSSTPYNGGNHYDYAGAPSPPAHGDHGYYHQGNSRDHARDMQGGTYNVDSPSTGQSGFNAAREGNLSPTPSRSQHANYPGAPENAYSPHGGYDYDHGYSGLSHSGGASPPRAPSHSGAAAYSQRHSHVNHANRGPSNFNGERYERIGNRPHHANGLGVVNPNLIADDGDDGLEYHRSSQRTSVLSLGHSDRGKQAIPLATPVNDSDPGRQVSVFDVTTKGEKNSSWLSRPRGRKQCKWIIIIFCCLLIVGAILAGVLVGVIRPWNTSGHNKDDSAKDDQKKNGDLDINSSEIKKLMNNPDLHKVFPGMDYTPLKTQYPDCVHDPPSQNNITRDVAVLSQLTNKIRLYGTDCNQTQMVLHAIDRLDMKDDIKVWLGVWQDGNKTTNKRQLDQMWTILEDAKNSKDPNPFEGIIVANEILFREEMKESDLADLMTEVRKKLDDDLGMDLPVATSDLGDDWTSALAKDSDYIMANIHPFFAGVEASEAASWTYSFWENQNSQYFKDNKTHNVISETGWPTAGGKNCGEAKTCTTGSVAGIDELNQFMDDWVCAALKNGTQYFWFEAFDEPWKIRFNEKGKNWEDQWGLMDVNRNLKDGVKIPDCDGKTVD